MRKNVFLKSILRQPLRALLLVVLVGVAAFAFVARATEYIIVTNEIARIESFYRSVGVLSPINPQNITDSHDVTAAAQVVGASRYVAFQDARVFTQGVLADRTNTISNLVAFNHLTPAMEGIDIVAMDMYFTATLLGHVRLVNLGGQYFMYFLAEVDGLLAGDGSVLRYEERTFELQSGRTHIISRQEDFLLPVTDEEAVLYRGGYFDPLPGVVMGEQYLFRIVPGDRSGGGQNSLGFYLRPLTGGNDGLRHMPVGDVGGRQATVVPHLRDDNLVFHVPTADVAAFNAMVEYLEDNIAIARENLHTLTVVGTQDMTAMPRMQNPIHARLAEGDAGGRWLTYEDHVNQNHVAVVNAGMAARRNLRVGETFTITLRDNPRPAWIDRESDSPWTQGIEGWWESVPQNWWGLMESHENWRDFPTHELTLEVVGVYWFFPPAAPINNFTAAEIYIPASLIPAGFGWSDAPMLTGNYNFVLTGPRAEQPFLDQNWQELNQLGFVARFLPNGFGHFAGVSDPIITSITVNLAIFSGVSVIILALVVFLYLRQWRRTVAIARALGAAPGKVLRRLFMPVFFMWVPAISAGAAAAWFFAIHEARANLAALGGEVYGGYEETLITPDIIWLPIMAAAIAVVVFAGILIFGAGLARQPVLEQLQGVTQKRVGKKQKSVDLGTAPQGFAADGAGVASIAYVHHMQKSKSAARRAALTHSLRHIFRAPVKSLLGLGLALFFMLSLGWLYNTINFMEREVERLWDETIITAQIARSPEDDRHFGGWQAYFSQAPISQATLDTVISTSFVDYTYKEALWQFGFVMHPGSSNALHEQSVAGSSHIITGVSHLDGFIEENTRDAMDDHLGVWGSDIEIEFAPGFGPESFAFDNPDLPIPVILRRELLESEGLSLGGEAILAESFGVVETTGLIRIIGVFDGGLSRAVNRFGNARGAVIMPLEALQYKTYDHWLFENWDTGGLTYITARLTLNPARNRQLDELHTATETALARNTLGHWVGPMPLELLMDDDVLTIVIPAMEQNLSLFRVLFPIAVGVSIALAIGTSILLMMQNAKNAAVMRVLGKTGGRVRFALCIEQILVCVTGIVLGLGALFIISAGGGEFSFAIAPLVLAGFYFAGVVLGSVIGAIAISAKTPLEMLQVRE